MIATKLDFSETRNMHKWSNNLEISMDCETEEMIEEFFWSVLQKHQEGLEETVKRSGFVFDNAYLLYYKLHKISLNKGGSYKDSPKCLKNEKARKNPKIMMISAFNML